MTEMLSRQQRRQLARKSQKHQRKIEKIINIYNQTSIHDESETNNHLQAKKTEGWVPKHQEVEIAGKLIPGLVYVGTPPQVETIYGEFQRCSAYIDPSLPINMYSKVDSQIELNPSCSYDSLNSFERNQYLDWLVFW